MPHFMGYGPVHIGIRFKVAGGTECIVKQNHTIHYGSSREIGIPLNSGSTTVVFNFGNNPNIIVLLIGPAREVFHSGFAGTHSVAGSNPLTAVIWHGAAVGTGNT